MDLSLSELRGLVLDREAWCTAVHGVTKGRTRLSDWTELIIGRDGKDSGQICQGASSTFTIIEKFTGAHCIW